MTERSLSESEVNSAPYDRIVETTYVSQVPLILRGLLQSKPTLVASNFSVQRTVICYAMALLKRRGEYLPRDMTAVMDQVHSMTLIY